ncbi:MAG: hypothetical protein CSA22_10545 [Deltaproteobacteria bacterium]|nr:MAG: hypothetical protein CSA22_10545 [Deltaproteobacteria bacterium]
MAVRSSLPAPHPVKPFMVRMPACYELADTATPADGWCMTRDNVTGLVWEVKTDANKDDTYTWAAAQTYCNNLALGGYDDWRGARR